MMSGICNQPRRMLVDMEAGLATDLLFFAVYLKKHSIATSNKGLFFSHACKISQEFESFLANGLGFFLQNVRYCDGND
ncbi:hypothetical protein OUZ56_008351 [Daphnia magna]|uniref:Uncharacterized protein n=1 Tax=Daphnia magna TaxID=35525 RepID=A0ABR0ACR9_9CRUS|nr:hypothetical protein OUZ56_008351 [Daphnia magna]